MVASSTASVCPVAAGLVEISVNLTIGRAADAGGDARKAGARPRSGALRACACTGNRDASDDAITGALLAEVACCAAAQLAAIRIVDAPGDPRPVGAAELGPRAPVPREEAG